MTNPTSATTVITIDGPAGAGKSTVARLLANRLGFEYLDTGAMYRAVTWAALQQGVGLDDAEQLAQLVERIRIDFDSEGRVWLDGEDVTDAIRQPEVSACIGKVADNVDVRRKLTELQRAWVRGRRVVTDGRDQGTEVFPDASCKFFLTASKKVRAERRWRELRERGIDISLEEVLRQQERRDQEDQSRPVGALRQAPDAIVVATDGLTPEQVTEKLVQYVRERLPGLRIPS